MITNKEDPKVIVALDFEQENKALDLVHSIDANQCKLKVGKEMFTYFGPQFVKKLVNMGFDVFLDLKFHDIPNTVSKACQAAAELGVWMVNVHASGGPVMMEKAANDLAKLRSKPLLTAVTVLTSMEEAQLKAIGISTSPIEHVKRLANLAKSCGLDGVVCSAMEVSGLKSEIGSDFKFVTPGIRPVGSASNDQKRIMTPQDAIASGVDYMVIGRPITQSKSPSAALQDINLSISW